MIFGTRRRDLMEIIGGKVGKRFDFEFRQFLQHEALVDRTKKRRARFATLENTNSFKFNIIR